MRGCEALVVELPGYVGGKLDASTAVSVQRHLQACSGCQAELRGIEQLDQLLAVSLPSISPSPGFASSFANRLAQEMADEESEQRFSPRALMSWLVQPWLLPVGAAAVLAVIVYGWSGSEQSASWSVPMPSLSGGVASQKSAPAADTKLAAKPADKSTEKKVLAQAAAPAENPPPDLLQRPELFVDYAIIRDLDELNADKAG